MKYSQILILFVALVSSAAHSACVLPEAPSVPDGATATKDELIASSKAVKTYISDANGYLECLDQEEAAAGEDESDESQQARVESYNSAIDSMEAVAAAFNEARVTFLELNPQ